MFISYAQHGEDVILWRALREKVNVTYVDVGAFDPTYDSVTRALYERGWRGVNIEAQPDRIASFEAARPEDTNLALAIGAQDGDATLTLMDIPGWATTRKGQGTLESQETTSITVPMRTLGALLPELGLDHVDVLKVDVEGAEADVVRGLLAGPVRPTVCVIEGVSPGFGRQAGDEAVALLVEAGYRHCMFDGLNHYLTTDPSLVDALSVPANPLDEYMNVNLARLLEEREELLAAASTSPTHQDSPAEPPEQRQAAFLRLLARGGLSSGHADSRGGGRELDPAALESLPDNAAISVLYRAVLARAVDPSALEGWSKHLAAGNPLISVARALIKSDEAGRLPAHRRAEVQRLMRRWRAFHNLVELGAGSGEPPRTYRRGRVADVIYIRALYRAMLDREPSADELEGALTVLEGGVGREALLAMVVKQHGGRARQARARLLRTLGRGPSVQSRDRVAAEEIRLVAALAATYADVPDVRAGRGL